MGGATSSSAFSPTTMCSSTPPRPASIGSFPAKNVQIASFAACARSRSTPSLRAEALHQAIEVGARGGHRLLRAGHLEEVGGVERLDDRAEERPVVFGG